MPININTEPEIIDKYFWLNFFAKNLPTKIVAKEIKQSARREPKKTRKGLKFKANTPDASWDLSPNSDNKTKTKLAKKGWCNFFNLGKLSEWLKMIKTPKNKKRDDDILLL